MFRMEINSIDNKHYMHFLNCIPLNILFNSFPHDNPNDWLITINQNIPYHVLFL